jgi:hypothetical protein
MKKTMVVQYIRAHTWWRLDNPGLSPVRVARSVVALLDAAACIAELPESHPNLEELERAGCFAGGVFNPGNAGLAVVRGWELADEPTGTEQDLLGALTVTVSADRGGPSTARPPPGGYSLPHGDVASAGQADR